MYRQLVRCLAAGITLFSAVEGVQAGWGSHGGRGVGYSSYGSHGSYGGGYASHGVGYSSYGTASYASYGSRSYASTGGSSGGGWLSRMHSRVHHRVRSLLHHKRRHASSGGSYSYGGGYSGGGSYSSGGSYVMSYGASSGGGYGSHGSTSYGSYGSTSYGSHGTSYGSYGGGSHGASYGSYGGTTVETGGSYYSAPESHSAESYASAPEGTSTETSTAMLTVSVPTDAKVFVNGRETTSTGDLRRYVSRGLDRSQSYTFEVRAQIERDGQSLEDTKTITVKGGQTASLVLDPKQAVETTLTLNVPETAKVFLAGRQTTSQGPVRTFRTTRLTPGKAWTDYEIRVELDNGLVKTESIQLKAGDSRALTFDFEGEAAEKIASTR